MSLVPPPPEAGPPSPCRLAVLGSVELTGSDGRPIQAGAIQSKRLALLTYLALAPRRAFVRRDTLLGLFWPEFPAEQARHALRQALHYLRSTLGREVIAGRGEGEITLAPDLLWSDVRAFEDRLTEGDAAAALALYRGDLLEGVFVSETSPELERWLEEERARLRRLAVRGAWELAKGAERSGQPQEAAAWARRAQALDPDDETSLRSLMELLERQGDRAGALRAYDEFARRLASEFDAEPSSATRALRERLGATSAVPVRDEPRQAAGMAEGAAPATAPATPLAAAGRRRSLIFLPVAVGALAVAALASLPGFGDRRTQAPPVIAVGAIQALGTPLPDSLDALRTLRALLATDLARLRGVQVLSQARLYEMLEPPGTEEDSPARLASAARRAGATELLEGDLMRRNGALRLELRRVDATTGTIVGTLAAEGEDLFTLVSQATGRIAEAHDVPMPSEPAALSSRSLLAQSFHDQGVRAFFRSDFEGAKQYFLAALEEDSSFVAPVHYLARIAGDQAPTYYALLARAVAASHSAPERERLQVRFLWADLTHDPSLVAYAESLAARYPAEPEGAYALGRALHQSGDFNGAIAHLRRAMRDDSLLGFREAPADAPCRLCEARSLLTTALILVDSLEAAERLLREARRRPADDTPGTRLAHADVLELLGRHTHALTLLRDSSGVTTGLLLELEVRFAIHRGDLAAAHRVAQEQLKSARAELRSTARWWEMIVLRTAGRIREAEASADRYCAEWEARRTSETRPNDLCGLAYFAVLLDAGRPAEAARLIEAAISRIPRDTIEPPGLAARRRTWLFAMAGTGWAAAGDTLRLRALADSAEAWGRLSAYGRDRRIHHHLRGLLWTARGDTAAAMTAFRRSIWSVAQGYTRTNLELGRLLMATGRYDEAVSILEPATRGPATSLGLYATLTEIHARLAEAYDAAGHGVEARRHLEWTERAWKEADPPIRARLEALNRQLGPPTGR